MITLRRAFLREAMMNHQVCTMKVHNKKGDTKHKCAMCQGVDLDQTTGALRTDSSIVILLCKSGKTKRSLVIIVDNE